MKFAIWRFWGVFLSDLVMRIENCMKEQRVTFAQVERACGFGNGTIKRWNEQIPRLDKLIVVAEYFHVSLDYLVFGDLQLEKKNLSSSSSNHLEEIESDLLSMFRFLDGRGQEDVIDFVTMKYEKATGEKESIYWTYIEDEEERQKKAIRQNDEENSGTA